MFTVKIKLIKNTRYPVLGIIMEDSYDDVSISFEATEVLNISNGVCVVALSASIEGCVVKGVTQHSFDYYGQGNPLGEGEKSFHQKLISDSQ